MKISILGAGAWGTALAIAFSSRHAVALWARDAAQAAAMQASRENARYLPGCALPAALRIEADFNTAVGSELNIVATPLAVDAVFGISIRATALDVDLGARRRVKRGSRGHALDREDQIAGCVVRDECSGVVAQPL